MKKINPYARYNYHTSTCTRCGGPCKAMSKFCIKCRIIIDKSLAQEYNKRAKAKRVLSSLQ